MKQMQFELWQECGAKCSYCYLGHLNICTPDEEKINTMDFALKSISNLNNYKGYDCYDTIAYIGGEFFQGQMKNPLVKEKFMELMKKTNWLKNNGYIKNVWIYATLTIGNQEDLYDTLDVFDDKRGLWVLTSYDTIGRFHTKKMEDNWKYHMNNIHLLYPDIKFNTTSIITGDLIKKYLNNEYNIKDFMEKYNTTVYYKVPNRVKDRFITNEDMNKIVGDFFPTRNEFLSFLKKVKINEDIDIWNRLFGIEYRADTLFCKHNNQIQESTRNKNTYSEIYDNDLDYFMRCGHLSVYSCYSDKDGCALCDKRMIGELYNG